METKEAKLEGARAKLKVARVEVAHLEVAYSKSQEDTLMETSHWQAITEAT